MRDAVVIPYCWFIDEALGGSFWMHNYGDDYTWLGGYVMQAFRGPDYEEVRTLGWQACERALREDGMQHMFSVVLAHNKPAQVWTTQCCGFTPLGVYRDWTVNRGQWTDGVVFCKNYPHDQSMAWTLAERRVETVRRTAHSTPNRQSVKITVL